jgi:hypothetical protein
MYIQKNVLLPSAVTLCTIGLLSCNSKQDVSKEADKPNIIYIYADDLGYGDLGCYGEKYPLIAQVFLTCAHVIYRFLQIQKQFLRGLSKFE